MQLVDALIAQPYIASVLPSAYLRAPIRGSSLQEILKKPAAAKSAAKATL